MKYIRCWNCGRRFQRNGNAPYVKCPNPVCGKMNAISTRFLEIPGEVILGQIFPCNPDIGILRNMYSTNKETRRQILATQKGLGVSLVDPRSDRNIHLKAKKYNGELMVDLPENIYSHIPFVVSRNGAIFYAEGPMLYKWTYSGIFCIKKQIAKFEKSFKITKLDCRSSEYILIRTSKTTINNKFHVYNISTKKIEAEFRPDREVSELTVLSDKKYALFRNGVIRQIVICSWEKRQEEKTFSVPKKRIPIKIESLSESVFLIITRKEWNPFRFWIEKHTLGREGKELIFTSEKEIIFSKHLEENFYVCLADGTLNVFNRKGSYFPYYYDKITNKTINCIAYHNYYLFLGHDSGMLTIYDIRCKTIKPQELLNKDFNIIDIAITPEEDVVVIFKSKDVHQKNNIYWKEPGHRCYSYKIKIYNIKSESSSNCKIM